MQRKGGLGKGILHSVGHSTKGHDSQGWAKLKLRARNSIHVFQVCDKDPSFAAFPEALAGTWMGSETAGVRTGTHMGPGTCKVRTSATRLLHQAPQQYPDLGLSASVRKLIYLV